jgi:Fe2+ transport system protein FeoA
MSLAQPTPLALPVAPPSPADRPLCELAAGESAVIASVDAAAAIAGRLLDLGFVPGTRVRVIRVAPLGDPTVYELRGYRICLRRSEAVHVLVRPA